MADTEHSSKNVTEVSTGTLLNACLLYTKVLILFF